MRPGLGCASSTPPRQLSTMVAAMPYDPELHGPRVLGPGFRARVFALVAVVPRGRVTTYGDLAAALGRRHVARHVGNALGQCPRDVAWHRVVNGQGCVSRRADGRPSARQIALLRGDGLRISRDGRIADFAQRRWQPGPWSDAPSEPAAATEGRVGQRAVRFEPRRPSCTS